MGSNPASYIHFKFHGNDDKIYVQCLVLGTGNYPFQKPTTQTDHSAGRSPLLVLNNLVFVFKSDISSLCLAFVAVQFSLYLACSKSKSTFSREVAHFTVCIYQ